MDCDPESLFAQLKCVPDPRRREGRRYCLSAILGLVVLGTLHGEDALRGIWVWARYHWSELWLPLGFGNPSFPAYNTLRNVLARLDANQVDRLMRTWLEHLLGYPVGGVSADGKVLRGSRRAAVPGLGVVALVHQTQGSVLAQEQLRAGEGEVTALLRLLGAAPLGGRVVTLDAGLTTTAVTQVITERGGDYIGVVKGNQPEVKQAVDDWVAEQVFPPPLATADHGPLSAPALRARRPPDVRTVDKSRGRLEVRELWLRPADELGPYLAQEWGWTGVQQVGWLRRRQQRRPGEPWLEEDVTIISSLSPAEAPPEVMLSLVRQHWCIENRVHWVRDVSFSEDQRHGRAIGPMLAWARNLALTLFRQHGFQFVPDGWRFASANLGLVLLWLTGT